MRTHAIGVPAQCRVVARYGPSWSHEMRKPIQAILGLDRYWGRVAQRIMVVPVLPIDGGLLVAMQQPASTHGRSTISDDGREREDAGWLVLVGTRSPMTASRDGHHRDEESTVVIVQPRGAHPGCTHRDLTTATAHVRPLQITLSQVASAILPLESSTAGLEEMPPHGI